MITVSSAPLKLASAANPMLFEVTSDDVLQPNHRFLVNLTMDTGIMSTSVQLLEFPYDSKVRFDISETVLSFLRAHDFIVPLPTDGLATRTDVSDCTICKYKLQLVEQFAFPLGAPSSTTAWPTSPETEYYALNGGFSYPNWPEGKYMRDWILQRGNNAPFLTWKPLNCLVGTQQPEYLTYIDLSDTATPRVLLRKVIVTFEDQTTSESISTWQISQYFKAYRFPVGYGQLGLPSVAATAGKKIKFYDVALFETTNQRTETRRYYVDYNKHQAERYLLFQNSLGGCDTVRFIGTGEFQSDYSRLSAEIYNGRLSNQLGTRSNVFSEEQAGRKINTGWITRKDVQWLRDLFLSRNVFAWEDNRWIPVEIVSKKLALQEEAHTNALTVEYDYKFRNQVYTPSYQTVNYIP